MSVDRQFMWGSFVILSQQEELIKVDAIETVGYITLQSIDLIIPWMCILQYVTICLEEIHDCIRKLYRNFFLRLPLQGTTSLKSKRARRYPFPSFPRTNITLMLQAKLMSLSIRPHIITQLLQKGSKTRLVRY